MKTLLLATHTGRENGDLVERLTCPDGQDYGMIWNSDHAARIVGAVNACCNLTLPDSAPPGILAEIVEQARRVDTHGRQYGSPGHEAECRALVELLAKLSP